MWLTRLMSRLADLAKRLVVPADAVSTGWPKVRDTCVNLGWQFDEWQDDLGRLLLSKRTDGLYAASICAMSLPRQVGKTYLVGCIAFALCLGVGIVLAQFGQLSVAELVAFFAMATVLRWPMESIGFLFSFLLDALFLSLCRSFCDTSCFLTVASSIFFLGSFFLLAFLPSFFVVA